MAKLTGKAGTLVFGGTTIPFKVIKPKGNRKLADTTDSANYDTSSDMVHMSQLPVTLQTELSVEGLWDTVTTDASLVTKLYSGAAAVATVINLSATVIYGHGDFDIENFEASEPIDDVITWTATLKSNGIFVHGS